MYSKSSFCEKVKKTAKLGNKIASFSLEQKLQIDLDHKSAKQPDKLKK